MGAHRGSGGFEKAIDLQQDFQKGSSPKNTTNNSCSYTVGINLLNLLLLYNNNNNSNNNNKDDDINDTNNNNN